MTEDLEGRQTVYVICDKREHESEGVVYADDDEDYDDSEERVEQDDGILGGDR